MPIMCENSKIKLLSAGGLKKIYCQNETIYSSGNICTYQINSNTIYQEEVDEGESCLRPKTFTPSLDGWTFVGWREDQTASGDVLTDTVMGDDPVTLYAVFRQAVTVTYYNNSTTASSTSAFRYYNNGNTASASFNLTQAASSGWTARGWSTSNVGNASITYANGATFTRDSNITLYGLYQQTITLSYSGNGNTGGSTAAQTATRYGAPAGVINPSFTVKANGFTRTNYIFTGWKSGNTAYAVGQTVTLSANLTLSAQWYTAAATNFAYTGGIQTWTVPISGLYLLKCYGAKGGNAQDWRNSSARYPSGGNGGYAYRYVQLNAGQTIYVVCGGAGISNGNSSEGGYNGGGKSGHSGSQVGYPGSGGGATHIATRTGMLKQLGSTSGLLIVAGGGGGAAAYAGGDPTPNGGAGGGLSGGNGNGWSSSNIEAWGIGGGQNSAGPAYAGFGYGGGAPTGSGNDNYNGGGGAGLYGGGAGRQSQGGGGGSSYIGASTTTFKGKTYTNGTTAGQCSGNGSASVQLIAA